MHFGVVGINHKLADLRLRELLAQACHRRFSPGHSLEYACVLLSTCNRTEIYFTSHDLVEAHSHILNILRSEVEEDFDQKLYSFFSQDCFCHLARVTAGLDSAILAETEIQGQVKIAYEQSAKYQVLPSPIHFLFQKALKMGKQVRTKLNMPRGMPDLEDAIFEIGSHHFRGDKSCRILFVGASAINLKLLHSLHQKKYKDLTLCNRSPIEQMEYAKLLSWDQLGHWPSYDWVILGTKSPHHLLHYRSTFPNMNHKLIMDLSVPRNADPQLREQVTLMNIDEINCTLKIHKEKMEQILADAERLIAEAVIRFARNGTVKLQLAV